MTALLETHLIPNPHLNLFLSRTAVTHTHRGATRHHFPELLLLGLLLSLFALKKKKKRHRPGETAGRPLISLALLN